MIRRLIILLLIVGCAHKATIKPPLATFYIGMTEEVFKKNNPDLHLLPSPPPFIDMSMSIENEGSLNEYIFAFDNDTLFAVYHNIWNMTRKKEIDYSKYPDSKPE